ncbi:MAG TPA: type II toxin-antitoxin system HipA family toxin [Mycobacteriales bacterium]|nr:type II toxin-antitoxin system HipA family toxin [Mycobacteriales bacterium]
MTTSESAAPSTAFVWIWLPGAREPVVAGRVDHTPDTYVFTYGRSYLSRDDAIPLYLPELPLQRGRIQPVADLTIAGCLRDAGPDAWGQRVILARRLGHLDPGSDTGALSVLTYLLESGSDRIGALDFQHSATDYLPRSPEHPTLQQMQDAAERLDAGERLPPALAEALLRGTSIGGARPKVTLLDDTGRPVIAKLSTQTDTYPVVKYEAVAMALAERVGVHVARTRMTRSMGKDVLLVDRFDRPGAGRRTLLVSALTILELDEFTGARYGSYLDLADHVRARFTDPTQTLAELFRRIVVNICVSNTDDHARNHAAFWDGAALTLTPAYDISPSLRSGDTASQAMALTRDGRRTSRLELCRRSAADYLLTPAAANAIIDEVVTGIEAHFDEVAAQVGVTDAEHAQLWQRLILHPSIHYKD